MNRKILLVGWGYPPDIDGGLDIHVTRLFEELRELGIDVDLALPAVKAPDRERIIGLETGDGDMVQQSRRMSQEIAEIAEVYDIIHTHDWFGAESGFKAQKYGEVDWISTFHSLSSGRNRNPSERLQRLEKVAAEESDKLIAVSGRLADEVEQEFGIRPEVIHNGFSVPESSGFDVKEELGIEDDMIFFVGRHSEQKGIEHLLYGFKKLLRERDTELVIGGEGYMTDSLKEFAEMLEVEGKVHFTGYIPDKQLGDYYRAADVFVSPSINEPFGLTITEALETGTPVVATGSGVEEIVGDSIISVDRNSDSLKQGMVEALDQGKEIDFTSRSWSEMAEDTIEIYEKLG